MELMADPLEISGENREGVAVITVHYGPEGMLRSNGVALSTRLRAEYDRLSKESVHPSLVVNIQAETAGSPLIRALIDLYKSVISRKGQLLCAGYPRDFVPALRALGITALPGFRLVSGGADQALAAALA